MKCVVNRVTLNGLISLVWTSSSSGYKAELETSSAIAFAWRL